MTVGELGQRMSSRELTEWMAYDRLEPFGDERADLRQAITSSVIANSNRDPKKRATAYEPSDFMPFREEPEPDDPPDTGTLAEKLKRALKVTR